MYIYKEPTSENENSNKTMDFIATLRIQKGTPTRGAFLYSVSPYCVELILRMDGVDLKCKPQRDILYFRKILERAQLEQEDMKMEKIQLRIFQDQDLKLLKEWLKQDYILTWYSEPEDWIKEVEERHGTFHWINHFIVDSGEESIGFCQYYPFHNSGETWNGNISKEGTYSIDYLIGKREYLGKGLGCQIVCLLTEKIFEREDAKRVIVQPEPENDASCNTLLSAGYEYEEENKLYLKLK